MGTRHAKMTEAHSSWSGGSERRSRKCVAILLTASSVIVMSQVMGCLRKWYENHLCVCVCVGGGVFLHPSASILTFVGYFP